uniref:Ubiquinone biosynthesis protein COQ4 homolog, mitochondrial n=1 Tax=Parascaris univalens TaxID=6257 RepID=A0A915A9H8_PARUN
MNKLYPTHIPTSSLQKGLLAIGSAVTAISNPVRGDMVAVMGETTAFRPILENIRRRMERDVSGNRLLRERPRITNETIDRDYLKSLPDGTLGREYMKFLDRLHTEPDARPTVKYVDDDDLVYVMQRYRETHDFNHIILQMRTHMLGEVVVKYFEGIQLGLPMCVLGGIFGGSRLKTKHRRLLIHQYLPWCLEQAINGRLLIAFDWEKHFEKPLREVQQICSIQPFAK